MDLISEAQQAMIGDGTRRSPVEPHRAHDYAQRQQQLTRRRTRDVVCLRCRTIDHAELRRTHCRFCVGDVVPYSQEEQCT